MDTSNIPENDKNNTHKSTKHPLQLPLNGLSRYVKKEYIKLFFPNSPTLEKEDVTKITKKLGTEKERNFHDNIIQKLILSCLQLSIFS